MVQCEFQHDLAPGRVTDPVRMAQAQMIGEPGKMTLMVGNRQMTGWFTTRIPRAARESRGKSRACDSGSAAGTRIL